jgi:hypothetical protein
VAWSVADWRITVNILRKTLQYSLKLQVKDNRPKERFRSRRLTHVTGGIKNRREIWTEVKGVKMWDDEDNSGDFHPFPII